MRKKISNTTLFEYSFTMKSRLSDTRLSGISIIWNHSDRNFYYLNRGAHICCNVGKNTRAKDRLKRGPHAQYSVDFTDAWMHIPTNSNYLRLYISFIIESAMVSTFSPSTSKQKHNILTAEKKLKIISRLKKSETSISLAYFYNVGKTTITDIKKNREVLVSSHYKEALK